MYRNWIANISRTKLFTYTIVLTLLLSGVLAVSSATIGSQTISNSGTITDPGAEPPASPPTSPPNLPSPDIIVPDDFSTPAQAADYMRSNDMDGAVLYIRAGTYGGFNVNDLTDLVIYGDPSPNGVLGAENFKAHIENPQVPLNYPLTIIDGGMGSAGDSIIEASRSHRTKVYHLVVRNNRDGGFGASGSGIKFSYSDDVEIAHCVFHTLAGRGILWLQYDRAYEGMLIHDNLMYNVGYVAGFQAGRGISLTCAGGEIYNNWLTGGDLSEFGAPPSGPSNRGIGENGISPSPVGGGRPIPDYAYVHHNLVEHCGGPSIHCDVYNLRVEYNHVTDGAQNDGNHNCFWLTYYNSGGTFIGNVIHWTNDQDGNCRYPENVESSGNIFCDVRGSRVLGGQIGGIEYRDSDAGLPETPW